MANDVVYVRNTRPNAVLMRVDGMKITVERRGSREDTTAIPATWLEDPVVATFLHRGIIEQISKESFMTLQARGEGVPALRLKKNASEVNLPMSAENSQTPFVIADKVIDDTKSMRTPTPQFDERVPSTEEEVEQGVLQPKQAPSRTNLPETKEEQLERKVNELQNQIAEQAARQDKLLALLESQVAQNADPSEVDPEPVTAEVKPKPRARKPSGTSTKSTTRTTRKKKS